MKRRRDKCKGGETDGEAGTGHGVRGDDPEPGGGGLTMRMTSKRRAAAAATATAPSGACWVA